jgi:hypothetical protein
MVIRATVMACSRAHSQGMIYNRLDGTLSRNSRFWQEDVAEGKKLVDVGRQPAKEVH